MLVILEILRLWNTAVFWWGGCVNDCLVKHWLHLGCPSNEHPSLLRCNPTEEVNMQHHWMIVLFVPPLYCHAQLMDWLAFQGSVDRLMSWRTPLVSSQLQFMGKEWALLTLGITSRISTIIQFVPIDSSSTATCIPVQIFILNITHGSPHYFSLKDTQILRLLLQTQLYFQYKPSLPETNWCSLIKLTFFSTKENPDTQENALDVD